MSDETTNKAATQAPAAAPAAQAQAPAQQAPPDAGKPAAESKPPAANAAAPAKAAEEQKAPSSTGAEAKPKETVPAEYKLELPKDSLLPKSVLEKIATDAKARGLTQEQAQANVAMAHTLREAEAAELLSKTDGWKGEVQKKYGDKLSERAEYVKRAVERFAPPEFRKWMDDTGFGNNPYLFDTFSAIGEAMREDRLVQGSTPSSGAPKRLADRMYPKMAQGAVEKQ